MKKTDLQALIRECLDEVLGEHTAGRSDDEPEIGPDGLITVIEVDQWTSTGDFTKIPFDELTLDKIHGGDADTAKRGRFASFKLKKVGPDYGPYIGSVWLAKGPDGFPFVWKYNYDSSG